MDLLQRLKAELETRKGEKTKITLRGDGSYGFKTHGILENITVDESVIEMNIGNFQLVIDTDKMKL